MKLIIDELTDENRIDAYLADLMSDFSRSKIQSEITALKKAMLLNLTQPPRSKSNLRIFR